MPMLSTLSSAHAVRSKAGAASAEPSNWTVLRRDERGIRYPFQALGSMVQNETLVMWGGRPRMSEVNTGTLKSRVIELVDDHAKLAQVINDSLFSFGELGFHEVETSKYLTTTLEQHGFTVERGVAGMPTGWVAGWGAGGPGIA